MTEPGSTGIGGDMFCLFYDAKTKKVRSLNGSGRSGKECTLEKIRGSLGVKEGQSGAIPMSSVHAVSVPGAAAGWVDTVEKFGSGKVSMEDILGPAIELGEGGFPVSEGMGYYVSCHIDQMRVRLWVTDEMTVEPRREPHTSCLAQRRRDAQKGSLR